MSESHIPFMSSGIPRARTRRQIARGLFAIAAVAGLVETCGSHAQAASITWANSGATYSVGTNWIGGTAPADSGADVAAFTGVPVAQPQLTAQRQIGMIDFQSAGWTFTGSQISFPGGPN